MQYTLVVLQSQWRENAGMLQERVAELDNRLGTGKGEAAAAKIGER